MSVLFQSMVRIPRDEFAKGLDLGVPLDRTVQGNEDVLMLYSPRSEGTLNRTTRGQAMPLLSVDDATVRCDTLKIVLTEPKRRRQCLAIMGQWVFRERMMVSRD